MRVVIDANVAIAAVASRGLCEAAMELCLESHQMISCDGLLLEIEEKIHKKLKVPKAIAQEYVTTLKNRSLMLKPDYISDEVCRDPDDLKILGLVNKGEVDIIITGDKDLLVLKKFNSATILSPREFWEKCTH